MGLGQVMGKPQKPPNLRPAEGPESCGTCRFFQQSGPQDGACRAFAGFPVKANLVCDSYEPKEEQQQQQGPPQGGAPQPPMEG